MGTRRSRHNKGRKPLYKEHRVADLEPSEVGGDLEMEFRRLRWPETNGQPACPSCGVVGPYEMRRKNGARYFKCRVCVRPYTLTSGTNFASIKMPLATLIKVVRDFQIVPPPSAHAVSVDRGINYRTATDIEAKVMLAIAAGRNVWGAAQSPVIESVSPAVGYWGAYKAHATGNLMKPGLNSLSELIIRPGIQKRLTPLLEYRGNMNAGHAHRLWNFALLMMAAEAETLSDGLSLAGNPDFSQLCGPHKRPNRLTLNSFFGRLWSNPEVTRNITGFTDYVKMMNLGPCRLTPVDPESPRANVAPWRKSLHEEPYREASERGAKALFYPYVVHNHERPDEGRDLVALVNSAVPSLMPPDIRADICQEIIVAILAGELERGNVHDFVQKYISAHFKGRDWKWAPGSGAIGSIDAPLSFDAPEGRTLHEVLHDGSYRHWSSEMDDEDEEEMERQALRSVLAKQEREQATRERRAAYRSATTHRIDADQLSRLIAMEEVAEAGET